MVVARDESRPTSVGETLRQTRPLRSVRQEALLALMLANEAVRRPYQVLMDDHGLTQQQYNVLRILRGAGRTGLPTLEIADRMIERTPGVTRMIDRLETKGWVRRDRSPDDRRVVFCRITPKGTRVLARLDGPVEALEDVVMGGLSKTEARHLIRLLNRVRHHLA